MLMRKLRVPLCCFAAVLLLGLANFNETHANTEQVLLTNSEVEQVLLQFNWRPEFARLYAQQVQAEVADLSRLSDGSSANGLTLEGCPFSRSRIFVDRKLSKLERAVYIEHEMHHVADYALTCSYAVEQIAKDFFSLGTSYKSVEVYLKFPREFSIVIHYNHDLIANLGWDISKLPPEYASKYFPYMQPAAVVPVATSRPTIVTVTPTPTPKLVTATPVLAAYPAPTIRLTPISIQLNRRIYVGQVFKRAA